MDAKKNVYLHRDKNLRLAVFVPEQVRAGIPGTGSHIATTVSRAAYHQLRACSASSSVARQDRALQTSRAIFKNFPDLAQAAEALAPSLQRQLATRLADGSFEFAYRDLPEHLRDQALKLEVTGGAADIALWQQSLSLGAAVSGKQHSAAALDQARRAFLNANAPAEREQARTQLRSAVSQANKDTLSGFTTSLAGLNQADTNAEELAKTLLAKGMNDFALMPSGHPLSKAIFESVPGLAAAAAGLTSDQQFALTQRLANGTFEFAYQALPVELQAQALSLELTGGPDDLALWHQSKHLGAQADVDQSVADNLREAGETLCKAKTPEDRGQAYDRLMGAVTDAELKAMKDVCDILGARGLSGDVADGSFQSVFTKCLVQAAITPAGHVMPGAFFKKLADALDHDPALQSEPPTAALRGFLVGQLNALADQPQLRQQIGSISAPAIDNEVIQDQLRADLGIAPPKSISSAQARMAVVGALLTPLRQGDVGSCFATSVAIRHQLDDPQTMVAQLKTMIERGYVEGKSGLRTERLPLNPGLGQSKILFSSDRPGARMQFELLHAALSPALAALGLGNSLEEVNKRVQDFLREQYVVKKGAASSFDDIVRDILADAIGLKFNLPDAATPTSERVESLLQRLRPLNSPAAQLDILRAAIRDLNTDLHRLSQAERVDDGQIDLAIDDLQAMRDLLPAQVDLGLYEQTVRLVIARLQVTTLGENRLLRTWEFSLSSAGIDRLQQGEIDSTLMKGLLTPRIQGLSAARGSISPIKHKELIEQLEARISRRINSDLVYQFVSEVPHAQASDGHSSRGGWVLFDRGGSAAPSQWRRIDSEHDLRMTLRGLVRQVSAELAQSRSSRATRNHVKALGNQLEEGLQGTAFERAVMRTDDRPAKFKASLIDSLVKTLLGSDAVKTQVYKDIPSEGMAGMGVFANGLARRLFTNLDAELRQCLAGRLVFRPAPTDDGSTKWLVQDSNFAGPLVEVKSVEELKEMIRPILKDAIKAAQTPERAQALRHVLQALGQIDLSSAKIHLSPSTDTSDALVHQPLWNVEAGGSVFELLKWGGAEGSAVRLVQAGAGKEQEEFFAQIVTGLRRIGRGVGSEEPPILVGTSGHIFSLTPQSWAAALDPAVHDPKDWLRQRLQPGQHIKLADMNWGTGSKPCHLALANVDGKIELGWAYGDHFSVSERAKQYANSSWVAWQAAASAAGGSAS
ncbi:MAG: hypothetical protein WCK08_04385 [Betaproteobacteria bacterium]